MSVKPKNLNKEIDGERYRTALSHLIADDGESTFLFRALNSNYFVQRDEEMDVVPQARAEELYKELPHHRQTFVAAFPHGHGGVGMDTPSAYDDEDEQERLQQQYGVGTTDVEPSTQA
jgi:hypothetical protein